MKRDPTGAEGRVRAWCPSITNRERQVAVRREFMDACDRPAETNAETLARILRENAGTEYGRAHGFSGIRSEEDYRRTVPLSTFDDYAELVYRETMKGEDGLMTSRPTVVYNKTSGTTGSVKRIPMTADGLRDLLDCTGSYIYGIARERFGDEAADGPGIWLSEANSVGTVPSGRKYAGLSGHLTLGWHVPMGDKYTSPREAAEPTPDTDTRYLHARFGLACADVTHIACTFASFILDMFHYIEKNWGMLCDDIEKGTIDASVRIPEDRRRSLEARLEPMPERAAELRAVFEQGFDSTVAARIWPRLAFVNCVCTGVFSSYMGLLREGYIGDLPVIPFGLTASEGVMTVARDAEATDSIPVPSRMYYEFLPLDSPDSGTVGLEDLVEGRGYELVITTGSGLYRYRTRDAVTVHGRCGRMPTLDYLFRMDVCANLNGEKTYEPALRSAMAATAEDLGFTCLDFCVYPNTDAQPPHYEFFAEMLDYPDGLPLSVLGERLEDNLRRANPLLEHPVYSEMCGPLTIKLLQRETYQLYHDKTVLRGGASTQVKPVKIISNEAQLRFFRILVDKDYERGERMRITREGNRVTALIEGKLDTGTSPDFESAMRAQLDGADEIVLDFRDAIYVSSAGLRVILGLEKEMESSGGKMRMINLPEMVMEVFVETGLSEILNIERGRGMDYHIRDMSAPDVRIDGMPATQELWAREDPYDLPGTNEVFLEAVRENLRRHSGNAFYRDWLERNGFSVDDLETIDDISKIPPIHANFYKTHTVKTARDEDIAVTLTSSGTSGQKSQMFFDEWSMFASDKSCDVQMAYYGHITHEPANFLMYSYEPAEGVTTGTLRTRQAMRRYARENELVYALKYTGEGHEFDLFGCIEALERFEKEGLPVYILGFPAFLYFTLQKMEAMGKPPLRLDPRSFVCMGGGWKGFADRQLSSAEFREYAGARLGLPDSCFRETYGAVEHGVGYTDCAEHHFHVPIHDRVIIRDPRTLEPLGYGEKGFINFVSPMNTAVPVTSLLMGDFGILHEPGSCPCGNPSPWLEVVGRAGVSKNKSCAIAAAEMLKGGSK